jgi:hypothetical protein
MTSDKQGWNQYKMDDDGNFPSTTTQKSGDLIGVLNFTDEDIVYRKKKVSKSFLRLSFYDSPNPETQMLLYYSTIFFDMNDLYAKYMNLNALVGNTDNNGRTENNLGTKNLVNYNDNDTYRLGVNFRVYDRFEKGKSSDGFYLYLFPDDLEEGKTKTIYMKVEFNHAGYGRTIPFIFARSGNNFYNFDDAGFPQTFDGKWDECNQAQYLPIKIQYDNTLKDYIYQFIYRPQNDRNITFNLYEPRLNSLV